MDKITIQAKTAEEKISRKEALQKAGKYAAFTAATMMVLLSTPKNAAASNLPSDPTPW